MLAKYRYPDGKGPCVGVVITPDNYEETFTVTIRSMRSLSEETVKNLLQTRYEVTAIEKTEQVITVR